MPESFHHGSRNLQVSHPPPKRPRSSTPSKPRVQNFILYDREPEHYYVGDHPLPRAPVIDLRLMSAQAAQVSKLSQKCAQVPVERGSARKCAVKVQKYLNKVMTALEGVQPPGVRDYFKDSAQSRGSFNENQVKSLRCSEEYDAWVQKCGEALRELKTLLKDIVGRIPASEHSAAVQGSGQSVHSSSKLR